MVRRSVSCSIASVFLCGSLGCATPTTSPVPEGGDEAAGSATTAAERVATLLTGRFDSSAQAAADSRYFPVQLRACAVALPALGSDVLYVEQAMLSAADEPYRQRVYAIAERDDGAVVSTVYELLQAERFVGFCELDATDQAGIMPIESDLALLAGCAVTLVPAEEGFTGSTDGRACSNDHNGATYATSEVTLTDDGIESWDRGYDEAGSQVWGAVAGPYRFDRKD
jgi:CpeT protein